MGTSRPRAAVIFDMDGVIAHSNPYHRRAWREVCRRHGRRVPEPKLARIYGRVNVEIVGSLFGRRLRPAQVRRFADEKEALYRALYRPRVRPLAGLISFLERLKRAGVRRAVATSAPPENVRLVLGRSGVRRYFRTVVDSTGVRRGKPHPDIFLEAARRLGVPPEACVVFEDSFAGLEAARRAGMSAVGVATTHKRLGGAALVIEDFRGLDWPDVARLLGKGPRAAGARNERGRTCRPTSKR